MGHVAGIRGRSVETYPSGSGGGGSSAGGVPLTRQRFIDGDTPQTGFTGAADQPFKTIAQFMASRTNASAQDATANYVGWVMPALNGYAENVSFPPYASTELRADSFSPPLAAGAAVTGNVTWNNVAGAHAASPDAVAVMHNVSVIGNITVTDDAGAPTSLFFFGGDEFFGSSIGLFGNFHSFAALNHFSAVFFQNAEISGEINTGLTGAVVDLADCTFVGPLLVASSLAAINSVIGTQTITTALTAGFSNCSFTSATTLHALGGAQFDGVSWMSFVESLSTRSPAGDTGTVVTVFGGYNGAPVLGAALPTGAVTTNVSLNGTGADVGYRGSNCGNYYPSTGLTGNGIVKLLIGGGEKDGDTLLISKTDLAAHTLTVQNNAGGTIAVIPSGQRGFVLARFSATAADWVFESGGSVT